ncbi:MAG: rhombosortase [Pseudomonadota bacterium]
MPTLEPDHNWRIPVYPGTACLAVISLLILLGGFLPESFWDAAAYQRGELPAAPWRAISAHWVHLGAVHAGLNAAALALLAALVGRCLSARAWLGLWLVASLAISLVLMAGMPSLERYVGASGVLHAIATGGGIALFSRQRLESVLLLGGVGAKLAWEQLEGPSAATAELIGGNIIAEAHLIGAISGLVYGLALERLRARDEL